MSRVLPRPTVVAPAAHRRALLGARRAGLLHRVLVWALLLAGSVLFLLPFLWMVSTSLKASDAVFSVPPRWLPSSFQWRNYVDGWTILPFTTFLRNSLIVTFANVLGNLVSCTLVAYGFARLRARGKNVLFLLLLATLMIPREVTIVPRFLLFSEVGLVNTLWPLILPAWFGYPFFIFLLRQFFMTIPRDLDDAARMDGASHLRILWDVILPLSRPALATVAIFSFIGNWTNLLDPLIYLRSTDLYTLALGLNLFRGQNFTQFNMLMAVSIITLVPVLAVFFLAQRTFIRGVTLTGMGGR
ncbi:MAG: ABC transporter, permease protein 2 (cluster 1, maltose/g3p/polyamine/iron) [uncultured Thermomicrobiales bacterium]|uniref:ABC transporter, permease protein 2 (Cluster 1, maltose/g3p/polyamine/iron) n=1 Tax=uncultured Thermomicrobiales bacterium TaxID=1645740 RepID=A0A6J4UH49_9BACT|nr:MAG: ABC transporter, permease protein 2 (cluster 1, maltose/g3p/polyamine/iron) [uncultured Thermomicrobiales bacterium]